MRTRGWLFASALATAAVTTNTASASEALFPVRYVACRAERETDAATPSNASPPVDRIPVRRRKPPPRLSASQLIVDDVAVAAPIPTVVRDASEPREALKRIDGQNDYLCIGLTRGKKGILRVLDAPPSTAWSGHTNDSRWPLQNMRAAGVFKIDEAIVSIRRELDRPLPTKLDYRLFERLDAKIAAMRALADLGDGASAPKVRAFLREREGKEIPAPWHDALESLRRLSPVEAQAYGLDVVLRLVAEGNVETGSERAREQANLVRSILPMFTLPDSAAVAALTRLSAMTERDTSDGGWHQSCKLIATRIRMGDRALEKELRSELSTDLRTQRGVMCFSEVIGSAFPGNDPDELDALFLRQRYEEILHLIGRMQTQDASGVHDARFDAARTKIRAWLTKRSTEPDIAGGPSDTRFQPTERALHLTALAALGDAGAKSSLFALIDDPKESGVAPWIGAHRAMRMGITGARDHAVIRLGIAMKERTERFSTEPFPERGALLVTEHGDVVDELVAEGDDRFVLGLLDGERFTRELTVGHLARKRPRRACELVARAATGAEDEAIQDAFWALSILGDACKPEMERLVSSASPKGDARAMATELLAMMRASSAEAAIRSASRTSGTFGAAMQRARLILDARE